MFVTIPEDIRLNKINKLHRHFESQRTKDWFSDEIILLIAKIFDQTIPNFSPCLYFREYSIFRYRGKNERVRISEININEFLTLMEAFHADISEEIINFFNLFSVTSQIKSENDFIGRDIVASKQKVKISIPETSCRDFETTFSPKNRLALTTRSPPARLR